MLLHYSQEFSSEADKELMKVSRCELELAAKAGACPGADVLAWGLLMAAEEWRSSVFYAANFTPGASACL